MLFGIGTLVFENHVHHISLLPVLSNLICSKNVVYFVGVQLDAKTKEIEWNPEKNFPKEEKDDGMPIPRHSLMIKQAILSHEAADGEIAVIEAEAVGYAQANIKTLISVLVQGKDHQRSLDLVFHDAPVKLRLVKGSGPVHLVGAHGVGELNKL